jgi:hypothetical protein
MKWAILIGFNLLFWVLAFVGLYLVARDMKRHEQSDHDSSSNGDDDRGGNPNLPSKVHPRQSIDHL